MSSAPKKRNHTRSVVKLPGRVRTKVKTWGKDKKPIYEPLARDEPAIVPLDNPDVLLAKWDDAYSEKKITELFENLRDGMPPKRAIEYALLFYPTVLNWLKQGYSDLEKNLPTSHAWFYLNFNRAEGEGQRHYLRKLKDSDDPRAWVRLLEVRWNKEFGTKQSTELSGPGGAPIQTQEVVDPEDQAAEDAAIDDILRQELLRKDGPADDQT